MGEACDGCSDKQRIEALYVAGRLDDVRDRLERAGPDARFAVKQACSMLYECAQRLKGMR